MIDTIILTLDESGFEVLDHHRFSPSTEGLYSPSGYYRLGGRANLTCVQNPTSTELAAGVYKPRLTVTKRLDKHRNFAITLKVEFSIPKLVFGNNFDELQATDFPLAVSKLERKLRDMGVHVLEPVLASAPVSGIHYSKNIPLLDYTTPYTYLERLSRLNVNQRLDLNQTDFRNEGHSLKFRANSFEVAFYDKMKDLDRAKISEKRAEESQNALQMRLFEDLDIRKPFEVLRMEVRLNRRQKLKQVLRNVGIDTEPTFQNLFSAGVAKKVLLHYMSEIEKGYPLILLYDHKEAKEFLSDFIVNNPKAGLRKAIQMLGVRILIDEIGVREFREITKKYGKASWYRLNKEMQSANYPQKEDPFTPIRKCLEEFKPLKLVDFQPNVVLNNVNSCER